MTPFRMTLMGAVAVLLACGGEVQNPTPPPDELAPEFEGGGMPVGDTSAYPGPYGVGVGSVIHNYKFFGYPRAAQDRSTIHEIVLADFHNPTGDAVFPDGSPYGEGVPKPKALILDRSAVWCPPCQYEASEVIPVARTQYGTDVEFLVTLDDGKNRGTRAVRGDLDYWVTSYNIDYPAVMDPTSTLSAIVGVDAYPGNVLVRTKDMKIIHQEAGVPQSAFWGLVDAVIAGQPIPKVD